MSEKEQHPRNYKIIREVHDHYEIEHPDGTTFKVAKAPLDDTSHGFIKALNFSDGTPKGPVGDYTNDTIGNYNIPDFAPGREYSESDLPYSPIAAESFAPPMRSMGESYSSQPKEKETTKQEPAEKHVMKDVMSNDDRESTAVPVAPVPSQNNPIPPVPTSLPGMNSVPGILTGATKQARDALTDVVERQKELKKVTDERVETERWLKDNPLYANRANPFASKNVGNKIAAALSVMVGGLSQGLTGAQSNPAMDVINKIIDRDIDEQKAKIGSKQTMLGDLMKQGHSLEEAQDRLRSHYQSSAKLALESAGQLAKTPQELQQIAKTYMELQQGQLAVDHQISLRNLQNRAGASVSGAIPIAPQMLASMGAEGEQWVPVKNVKGQMFYSRAASKDEAAMLKIKTGEAVTAQKAIGNILHELDQPGRQGWTQVAKTPSIPFGEGAIPSMGIETDRARAIEDARAIALLKVDQYYKDSKNPKVGGAGLELLKDSLKYGFGTPTEEKRLREALVKMHQDIGSSLEDKREIAFPGYKRSK